MSTSQKVHEPAEYKTIPAFVKVVEEEKDQGIVEHLVSIFGVLDLGGDIVHPGAFTKTLSERSDQIRVLDSHQRGSILNVLGIPLSMKEVPRDKLPTKVLDKYPEATGGLWARTQFLMDTPEGKGAFLRIKSGAVSEFSFGYDTLDEDFTKDEDGPEVRNLRTLRLWEYSPVTFGMNPATTVTDVKTGGANSTQNSEDSKPSEDKPVDVRETTIRVRVRDSAAFEKGSFRTINIGAKGNGIQAVIGRLKGKKTTTVQAYIFDKSKWTSKTAQAWVKEHGKEKALSYTRVLQQVRDAFHRAYNPREGVGTYDYWIKEVFDEFIIVEVSGERVFYKIDYILTDEVVNFEPRGEWTPGEYVFVAKEKPVPSKQGSKGSLLKLQIEMEQVDILIVSEAEADKVTSPPELE